MIQYSRQLKDLWRIVLLWRTVVQNSNSAALHTSVFSTPAPYVPALYPKTHLVQPLHCGIFLSQGIVYPSYTTLVLRKRKRTGRLFFRASSFQRKKCHCLTLCCYAVCCHPVVLKFQSSAQQKVCSQKITRVKKKVHYLVDR